MWGMMFLFSGGIALGKLMTDTKAVDYIAEMVSKLPLTGGIDTIFAFSVFSAFFDRNIKQYSSSLYCDTSYQKYFTSSVIESGAVYSAVNRIRELCLCIATVNQSNTG